ncbi:MAG: hypothetical protein Crog4KO_24590 [Crocinitomicaceae bacterium]
MQIKRFTFEDLDSEKFEKYKSSSSANRLAENPDDLTQEVIIIDGDEIRKFGYTTLVDVLKTIPGFRTSQPGNATEGETFLMRGLLGNDHTKILINGIPIKPEGVKSMPISAQLPIRHAEYIEIVQGPSSATYGSDAMAGVINIVLPEVDRPVFAWADVSGMTPATTDINLTLGGKAGSGKNILDYQIFASSQLARDVNLLINEDSIRFDIADLNQWEAQYYKEDNDDKEFPDISSRSRESRLIGANFHFRGFELFAMNMFREEHSSFGSSPLAVSYSDPSSTMGENINTVGLRFVQDNGKRFSSRSSFSVLNYRTIENASYIAIRDSVSAGKNYIFGRSVDFRADFQGILKFSNQLKMGFGATGQYSISNPYTSFLGRRIHLESYSFDLPEQDLNSPSTTEVSPAADSLSTMGPVVWVPKYTVANVAGFVHFLYKTKGGKLNIEGASRVDLNTTDGIRFTPKFGMVYRPVKKIRLVLNYGAGHRAPRSYHLYNNFWQRLEDLPPGQDPFVATDLNRSRDTLSTERLQGAEIRLMWDATPNLRVSTRYYAHLMQNRITRQVVSPPPPPGMGPPPPPQFRFGSGYYNNRVADTYSFLNAIMVTVEFRKNWEELSLIVMGSYEFASGYEEIEGEENVPESVERSADYRFVPVHSVKANINIGYKGFTLSINNNFINEFTSDIYMQNNGVLYDEYEISNYNLDILLHKNLFRQISLFAGAYNVLNSMQSGISASSLTNSWGYNPQYGRIFKIGLNYRLN